MALKLAKKAGSEYMIFNENLQLAQQYEENIKMANTIKDAIHNDKIIPYFQPIFDLKTEKVHKYEALVRLVQEDGSVLAPFFFLETSRKVKLYPQITKIMIQKTFSYFSGSGINFSINLSFDDILNKNTRKFLFSKIKEYKIASQLTIEILETLENNNAIIVDEFIEKVYESGAIIAIDDFGSGYANFQHMTTMRSDIMKIDGSLIKNIATDKNARLVVETIIVFAQKLNKKIIAEFVHSKEVYDIVKELGIEYAQGYYLGKPLENIL
jgi:EAL domain-containing protein (putative c-di-GMP-specific phosphodiesterase class I)